MSVTQGKLVGIDLGTTFSAIATLDERGQAVTLPNLDGEMLTPSAVLIQDGSAVVGQAARDVALELPGNVALLTKRFMGHPKFGYPVSGREFRPETLSAIILKKLVQDAERRIGPIGKAVITVPAYFDDTRRKATKDAGRIAGIDVLDILDEPTAAALAYSFQHAQSLAQLQEQTVLVYDLGGGTFDVTLVRLGRHRFESLAIEGDVRLGGKDWDDRIVDHVANQFKAKFGDDESCVAIRPRRAKGVLRAERQDIGHELRQRAVNSLHRLRQSCELRNDFVRRRQQLKRERLTGSAHLMQPCLVVRCGKRFRIRQRELQFNALCRLAEIGFGFFLNFFLRLRLWRWGCEAIPQAADPAPAPPAAAPAGAPAPAGQPPAAQAPKPAVEAPPQAFEDVIEAIEFRGVRRVPQDTLRAMIFTPLASRAEASVSPL